MRATPGVVLGVGIDEKKGPGGEERWLETFERGKALLGVKKNYDLRGRLWQESAEPAPATPAEEAKAAYMDWMARAHAQPNIDYVPPLSHHNGFFALGSLTKELRGEYKDLWSRWISSGVISNNDLLLWFPESKALHEAR